MKNVLWKKAVALVLVGTTVFSLCACGGKGGNGSGKKEEEKFYKTTYVDLPASFGDNMYYSAIKNGKVYFAGSNNDFTQCSVHCYDLATKEDKILWQSELRDENSSSSVDINGIFVDSKGDVLVRRNENIRIDDGIDYSASTYDDVINFFIDNWGYEYNEAVSEWDQWWAQEYVDENGNPTYGKFMANMNSSWEYHGSMMVVDADGNVLSEISEDKQDENSNAYVASVLLTDDGQIVTLTNIWSETADEYFVDVYDLAGNKTGNFKMETWVDTIIALPDGSVAITSWGDTAYTCKVLDLKTGNTTDEFEYPSSSGSFVKDKDHLYVRGESSLNVYDLKSHETERLFAWVDVELSSSSVNAIGTSEDGKIMILARNYNASQEKYVSELAYVEEAPASEFANVTFLTYAAMYLDWSIERQIMDFNRKHNDVKIRVLTFDNGTNWEDNLNQFTTGIATNKNIDLISFVDYSQVANLAAKGSLIDLNTVMGTSGDLKADDIMPGVLNACQIDGKLVILPRSFSVSTLVASKNLVGDKTHWSIDEATALWDSMPAGTEFLTAQQRDDLFSRLVSLNYNQFVDVAKGKCDFDNEDFIKILEFSNRFEKEIDWGNYEYDDDRFVNGQVMTDTYYLGEFYELQSLQTYFGGDISLIGYPCSEGNGAFLSLDGMMGITANCENPSAAWEFMSSIYGANGSDDYYGFSIRKSAFEEKCKKAMDPNNEMVGSHMGWDSYTTTIRPSTQEEVDMVRNLIDSCTAVNGMASDAVVSLILEEAQFYFNGERSADEVAKKVQSRMSIYLSETN